MTECLSKISWEEHMDGEHISLRQYDSEGNEDGHVMFTREVALQLAKVFEEICSDD